MGDETLQEFLVKIGWNLDELGYNKADSLIEALFIKMTRGASGVVSNVIKGSTIIIGALEGITKATVQLISKTAQLDEETEKWARRYWTTEQNARSLQSAMQAMGLSDLDDLYYATSEEYNRFLDLRNLGKILEAPKELDDFLVKIRDIQHEFNKLKVIFEYGTRWVVYYLGKMFGKDTEELLQDFKNIVNWIGKNLPKIAEKIAKALSHVINIILAIYNISKKLYTFINDVLDKIPSKTKATLAALGVVLLAFLAGPVGRIIAGISLLLLLLEDYYVWSKGGKSAFDYSKIEDFFNSPGMQKAKDILGDIFEVLGGIIEYIAWLISGGEIPEWAKKVDEFLEGVYNWLEKISTKVNTIFGGKKGNVEEDTWLGRANQIANNVNEDKDYWGSSITNPLLRPPASPYDGMNVVDNSSTDVNIDIKYNKESETFNIAKEIIRNTNYNLPVR